MKVLISWAGMIAHDWITLVINEYFNQMNSPRRIELYYKDNVDDKELVWTNHNRCRSFEIELFYRMFDKVIYIIRDPVNAMYIHYFWKGGELDQEFFKSFVDMHLTDYACHVIAHKSKADVVMSFESLANDVNYFIGLMKHFDSNINEEIFKEVYYKIRPIQLDLSNFPQELIDYIRNKWSDLVD